MHLFKLYHNMDRPVLEPTQTPIQWVPRYFTGVKWPGREANHSRLLPRLRMLALCTFMLWTGKTLHVFCGLMGTGHGQCERTVRHCRKCRCFTL